MPIKPSPVCREPRRGFLTRQCRRLAVFAVASAGVLLAGCGETKKIGDSGYIQGFVGGVATDEPRAAVVGRDILGRGGSAADAATAMFFTLAVTKPSAAGLGAVGACVYFDARNRRFSAFDFTPPPQAPTPDGRPQFAPPAAVRGMAALHARHGVLPWAELVGPAEALARFGHAVSRSLAVDLEARQRELSQDLGMVRAFGRTGGGFLREGEQAQQLELAATLAQIRQRGAGALFSGPLARAYADAAAAIGGVLPLETLRAYAPRAVDPILMRAGDHRIAFLSSLSTNGPQQARLWHLLAEEGALANAPLDARLHVVAETAVLAHSEYARNVHARPGGIDPVDEAAQDLMTERFRAFDKDQARPLAEWLEGVRPVPSEVSGASLVAVDPAGGAAACGFTLYRPFGPGRLLPGIGAPPALAPPPGVASGALGPIVVGNVNTGNFFLALAGRGSGASTTIVTTAARILLGDEAVDAAVGAPRFSRGGGPKTVFVEKDVGQDARAALEARGYALEETPSIGLLNAASCEKGLPRSAELCSIRTDWRGHGLAAAAK